MASDDTYITQYIAEDNRPNWPYELWTFADGNKEAEENEGAEDNKELSEKEEVNGTQKSLRETPHEELITATKEMSNDLKKKDQHEKGVNPQAGTHCDETEVGSENVLKPLIDQICTSGTNLTNQKLENVLKLEPASFVSTWHGDATVSPKDENVITIGDNGERSDSKKENKSGEQDVQTDEEVAYEPDHWSDELDCDIPESCPINALIEATASPDMSKTVEAQQTKDAITPMLESTLQNLTFLYKLFQGSFLLPVGSMAENTKIGKADEFDFAVILPILAQKEYIGLLDKVDESITDPTILSLLGEIWEGNMEVAANCFQQLLKELWSGKMMEHVPER